MLEHDATLHTRHGIERVMYRGRYSAEAVSYTAPQPHPRVIRARCQKCLLRRSRSQRIACDTCEPQVTSKSARRVCMLRYLVSSSAIGYTNRVFAVAAVLKRRYFLSHPLVLRSHSSYGDDSLDAHQYMHGEWWSPCIYRRNRNDSSPLRLWLCRTFRRHSEGASARKGGTLAASYL